MQHKPSKVQEMIANKIQAKNVIRFNLAKFYFGLVIVGATISNWFLLLTLSTLVFCLAEAFNLSSTYAAGLVGYWSWSFLFSIIADFVIVDGFFMTVVTLIVVNVGATPDACGRNRAMWLKLIPPAIKDSIEWES